MAGLPADTFATEADLARHIAQSVPGCATEAEATLYRRYAPRVRLFGLRHLRDTQAAADFMQQVMLVTIDRLRRGKLRDPEKLGSFIFGVCRAVMLELRRGGARRKRLLQQYQPDLVLGPEEPVAQDRDRVTRCLQSLPERERTVLVMTFYEEKPAQEVAAILGVSPGNVRVIRYRGLMRLRQCITGSEPVP